MKKTLTKNLKNAFLVILASLIIGACASTKAKDAGTVGQTQAQEQAQAQNNTVKSEVELDALIAQWYGNETNEFRKSYGEAETSRVSQNVTRVSQFEDFGDDRLKRAHAAYRKLLRDYDGQVTQFKVLSVMPMMNIYGQKMLSCQVVKVDVNGNGQWDNDVDATIMLSHTSKAYHNVQAGNIICLPIRADALVDETLAYGENAPAVQETERNVELIQFGTAQNPETIEIEYIRDKKFKDGLEYFKPSATLYDAGLRPIAVFKPEDAKYGMVSPFASVYYVNSSRDRDEIREFLDGFRGNLAGNNPHLYAARNILCVSKILAVNGVPVEFMNEVEPEERAKLMQDTLESSQLIERFYSQNTR